MKILWLFLYSFVLACTLMVTWHKLFDKKIDFKSLKMYISLFGITIISLTNYFLVYTFVRITLITIVFMFFVRYLFKADLRRSIITPIFYQIIIMISEGITVFILVTLLHLDINQLKNQFLATFVVNASTGIISIIIVYIPVTIKIYNYILNSIQKISKRFLALFSIVIISIANVLAATTYYEIDVRVLIFINVSFSLICFLIVLYSFKMQHNYNRVSDKYNIAINSLNDYESMMTKYRIENHENKNLLLTIRAMVINKEKDIPEYINSIIENKYTDNDKLLKKMAIIPSGGLRATIYSEILKIQDNNIKYTLNIDDNIKTFDLIELDTGDIIDICKIIGVLIDNAIEEVKKLKDKNIGISLYLEKEILNIKVSNNYSGRIEIDKIFDEGYTTKGAGRGYGLSLVKKIIDNNSNFSNKIEISDKIFSQILCIQYKKAHQ